MVDLSAVDLSSWKLQDLLKDNPDRGHHVRRDIARYVASCVVDVARQSCDLRPGEILTISLLPFVVASENCNSKLLQACSHVLLSSEM